APGILREIRRDPPRRNGAKRAGHNRPRRQRGVPLMLFDLRGRHRRRAVRVIYTGLALLIGVGLVGFGVGGGFGGGGLLNAASSNESSNAASFSNQIKKYEKLTREQPTNLSAWENLTNALLHEAGGEAYVTQTGVVTTKGKELFRRVARSWDSYLALNPPK